MKANHRPITRLLAAVLLCACPAFVRGQPAAEGGAKPKFTPEQRAALEALYEYGGVLLRLDEQRPGQPLVMVDFSGQQEFKDDWLKHLLPFGELTTVNLAGTTVTDAGVAHLVRLPKLAELNLKGTGVTDAGLMRLAFCKQLAKLNVQETRVSKTALALLRKTLPELKVDESPPTEKLSPEQALAEIKKLGGMLVHYDDRLPGNPVTMIDATNLPGFRDEWTRYFAAFPKLRQIGLSGTPLSDAGLDSLKDIAELDALILSGTKITDAGLAQLAGCKKLQLLAVDGTGVTRAGIAALRKALPQLEVTVEPEKLAAAGPKPTDAPAVTTPSATTPVAPEVPTVAADALARFSAQQIRQWREKLVELSQLPAEGPNGWAKSPIEPAKLLTVFPKLRVREGYVLRAYVFREDGNSNGFVWALPAEAAFPPPGECPRVESHFLNPPKPFDALDDMMEAIAGDDSLESYFQASILRREFKEFGGGWHGIQWGMHTVLDDSPWKGPPPRADTPPHDRPESKPEEWKWLTPQPTTWTPEVRRDGDRVVVTFYSYTPLSGDFDNEKMESEKERIIRHAETYRRGKYRPLVVEKKLAEGPNAIAH
jgi:hypothetical protein